ncbi:hypothetical protein MKK50_18020 [Methylobacterium sp. J-043]|nr:hypothetical protein [Methylobacterium sp. J-043]
MMRALTIHPDAETVPYNANPIFAAIDRHSEAWSVFQVAPEGDASLAADAETYEALHALLATPCATRAGALCLIRHLRWWLTEEAVNADAHEVVGGPNAWAIAEARETDLSLCLGVERAQRLPIALPSGRLIGPVISLRPVAASTPVHFGRGLSHLGETLAALVLIVGGIGLTSFATFL